MREKIAFAHIYRLLLRCKAELALHALGFLGSLIDCAYHIESLLRQRIVLAVEDLLETAHGFGRQARTHPACR